MSLAELCKSTAKKAKEKEKNEERKSSLQIEIKDSSEEELKPKPRIGPHTPPLPREPSSPRLTPEPSSTADFSKSYFQDEHVGKCKRHYHRHHRKCYISSSRSPSPIDIYHSRDDESRSYSVGSSRSYGNHISKTTSTSSMPPCKRRKHRESSIERERHPPVSGTRTVSPPPLEAIKAAEKKPYYVDKRRERDRLRRKYGEEYADAIMSKRSTRSPDKYASDKHVNYSLYYHNMDQRSLSRSKSPLSRTAIRTRSSGPEMSHGERYRRLSPMSERHFLQYQGLSRSRSRERKMTISQPPTQIITIPVAVPPDFPYALTSWPPQCGSSFPINSILPPAPMPPIRSPYGIPPYIPNILRPQHRYPHMNIYGPRLMRRLPYPSNRNQ